MSSKFSKLKTKLYQCFDYSWRFLAATSLCWFFQHAWFNSTFFFAIAYYIDRGQDFAHSRMIHKHQYLLPPRDDLMFHLLSIWVWFVYLRSFVKPTTFKDFLFRGVVLFTILMFVLSYPVIALEEKHMFIIAHSIVYTLVWCTISGLILFRKCQSEKPKVD